MFHFLAFVTGPQIPEYYTPSEEYAVGYGPAHTHFHIAGMFGLFLLRVFISVLAFMLMPIFDGMVSAPTGW